jgi:hypothetical protein
LSASDATVPDSVTTPSLASIEMPGFAPRATREGVSDPRADVRHRLVGAHANAVRHADDAGHPAHHRFAARL